MMHRVLTVLGCLVAAGSWSLTSAAVEEDGAPDATPTFARDVAPIVFHNCTQCHRPGEVGPFPLMDYKDTRKRGRMIERVVKSRIMPPWHPVEGHGEFEGELFLTADELETISAWVKGGMPEGDASKTPPLPEFTEGWQLGEPDLIVSMPEGFDVPASGRDIYRNFWVPVGLDEDVYLTAIEVRPGSRGVLHHTLFSFDTTGEARRADGRNGTPGFSGMVGGGQGQVLGTSTSALGGWAVGGMPRHLPDGLARKLPAGSDIVLQSHFHPSGKAETEATTLGLYFSNEPPERSMAALQLPPFFGIAAGLDVPAGEENFELTDSFVIPVDSEGVTVGGHAHYICKEMQLTITRPQEEPESIFYIADWDFDWQNRYQYSKSVDLPAGTRVDVRIRYDNSADNPNNPHDPPRRVKWGPESFDEMGSITLLMVARDEEDSAELRAAIQRGSMESMANSARRQFEGGGGLGGRFGGDRGGRGSGRGLGGLLDGLADRVMGMDENGDGIIQSEEIPERMRRFVRNLDANGDGDIDAEELKSLRGGGEGGGRNSRGGGDRRDDTSFRDLDGNTHRPLELGDATANVVIFTTTDCPVANSYIPTIRELVEKHAGDPLNFYLVHVDPDVTREAARDHAEAFDAPCPVLMDTRHTLVAKLGITITPEVAVITGEDEIAYRGRIDNWYGALQKKRPSGASRHELRDALKAVLAGKTVRTARTEAVGCDLPVLPEDGKG